MPLLNLKYWKYHNHSAWGDWHCFVTMKYPKKLPCLHITDIGLLQLYNLFWHHFEDCLKPPSSIMYSYYHPHSVWGACHCFLVTIMYPKNLPCLLHYWHWCLLQPYNLFWFFWIIAWWHIEMWCAHSINPSDWWDMAMLHNNGVCQQLACILS